MSAQSVVLPPSHFDTAKQLLRDIILDELLQKQQQERLFKPSSSPSGAAITPGKFIKTTIKEKTVFIYIHLHSWNWTASMIPFELFENVLYTYQEPQEISPCKESQHPFLCSLFEASTLVVRDLKLWIESNGNSALLPYVKNVLEQHNDTAGEAEEYVLLEEQWTDRLCNALKCHPSYSKLETWHGIDATKFESKKRKDIGLPVGCGNMYVVKGGPDLYLPLPGLVVTIGDGDEGGNEDPATVPHTPEPEPTLIPTPASTPASSFVAEHARGSMPISKFPYPKMGELIANMLIAHIDMIIKSGCVLKEQQVNGLFFLKGGGASVFEMKLAIDSDSDDYVQGTFSLIRYQSPWRSLTEQVLCSVLHVCTKLDIHKI